MDTTRRMVSAGLITGLAAAGWSTRATAENLKVSDKDYERLYSRWRDMLTGGDSFNPADPNVQSWLEGVNKSASTWWAALNKAPGRTYLWGDAASGEVPVEGSAQGREYVGPAPYNRLRSLALAWAVKGSKFYNNPELLADIKAALQFMWEQRFNLTIKPVGNWWTWQIGNPLALLDTVYLVRPHLDPGLIVNLMAAVNRFSTDPIFTPEGTQATAANRAWKSHVVLLRGLLVKDRPKIDRALAGLISTMAYVEDGDGFYADGSFIQHKTLAQNGAYGVTNVRELAEMFYLLGGSPFALQQDKLGIVYQWIYRAFEPLVYRGAMMDMMIGRSIAWPGATWGSVRDLTATLMRLSEVAPPEHAQAFKSMAKTWLTAPGAPAFFPNGVNGPDLRIKAAALAKDPSVPARPEPEGLHHLAEACRVVQRRPKFAFGLATYSARRENFEAINGENGHGWHTASGMTYLYYQDPSAYTNDFWPTVDPYRLPGTTVHKRALKFSEGQRMPGQPFEGGAALAQSGAFCMKLAADGGALSANKAWFVAGDLIVALGAGITCASQWPVETTIENRNMSASATPRVVCDGKADPILQTENAEAALTGARWFHLSGLGGYLLLDPAARVRALHEKRTGAWSDININVGVDKTPRTRRYVTAWIDHGVKPTNATYAYALAPGQSPDLVAKLASSQAVTVIVNTADRQGVQVKLGATTYIGAVFWQPGSATAGRVGSDGPACVMAELQSGSVDIAISDPTRSRSGPMTVDLDLPLGALISASPEIEAAKTAAGVRLKIAASRRPGTTWRASFKR